MEIGHILKKSRNEAGITQEQAAEALGVSRQTISNWENGKTFPDIVSVIRMSDLYSVSLDALLKEEAPVKKNYLEYLEESTNTVRSRERQEKTIVACVTFGIWALSVIAFWLVKNSQDGVGFSMAVTWAVLSVLFFSTSFILGLRNWGGRWKWLAAPLFGVMHALAGSITSFTVEEVMYRSVIWPDFIKLPVGIILSLAGLGLGILIRTRKKAEPADQA